MYKDFKQSESLDTGFVGGSGLIWMFSGIVLGLLVGVGMYYFSNDKGSRIHIVDSLQKKIENTQSAEKPESQLNTYSKKSIKTTQLEDKKAARKVNESQFSYYAVLPNIDVPVNHVQPINTRNQSVGRQAEVAAEKRVVESEPETESIGDYLLQVASFKKQSMADKTRGRLSNRGIDAYIQKKKIKGRLWYRVVAGPVDQTSVDNWKLTAEKLGHKPLVISVR